MKNKFFWVFAFLLMMLGIAGFLAFYLPNSTIPIPANANLESFAKCLASKGATMYGAKWCPHCLREKGNFGESFKYISYVECPDNIQLCTEKGITGYPTWIFGDGKILEGEQGLSKLSSESGCPLESK